MQHDFILLDRSGSMGTIWDEALSSVNAYVKKLAEDNVDTGVTLATFDTAHNGAFAFEIIRDRIIPRTWRRVSNEDCTPRGMTPLNDAIGKIVSLARAGNYDRLALIIMTDGHENASREVSLGAARKMLDECRNKGWVVVMLGANAFDNQGQASAYNNAPVFTASAAGGQMVNSMRATASKRATYGVTGQSATMGFSDEEKEEMLKSPTNPTPSA
jgi:von Willebrand factor type A domain